MSAGTLHGFVCARRRQALIAITLAGDFLRRCGRQEAKERVSVTQSIIFVAPASLAHGTLTRLMAPRGWRVPVGGWSNYTKNAGSHGRRLACVQQTVGFPSRFAGCVLKPHVRLEDVRKTFWNTSSKPGVFLEDVEADRRIHILLHSYLVVTSSRKHVLFTTSS